MADKQQTDKIVRWLVPAIIIGLCAGAIYLTTDFRKMPPILKRGIQPADFPRLVCLLIIGLACLMSWREPAKLKEKITPTSWITILLMIGFALLVQIDLFLALGAFAVALALLWGERRPARLATVGLVVPAAVFFLFDRVFAIRFPRGVLTSLWYG